MNAIGALSWIAAVLVFDAPMILVAALWYRSHKRHQAIRARIGVYGRLPR